MNESTVEDFAGCFWSPSECGRPGNCNTFWNDSDTCENNTNTQQMKLLCVIKTRGMVVWNLYSL